MQRIDENTYVLEGGVSGRAYRIRRMNRAFFRGVWDVGPRTGEARYGAFATLPGARRWALRN